MALPFMLLVQVPDIQLQKCTYFNYFCVKIRNAFCSEECSNKSLGFCKILINIAILAAMCPGGNICKVSEKPGNYL